MGRLYRVATHLRGSRRDAGIAAVQASVGRSIRFFPPHLVADAADLRVATEAGISLRVGLSVRGRSLPDRQHYVGGSVCAIPNSTI